MTYACNDCGFIFYRAGAVNGCPQCDRSSIREATEEEQETYRAMSGRLISRQRAPDKKAVT